MSEETVYAYGVDRVVSVEAHGGYVIVTAEMKGGERLSLALQTKQSGDLRVRLRDAEKIAWNQILAAPRPVASPGNS